MSTFDYLEGRSKAWQDMTRISHRMFKYIPLWLDRPTSDNDYLLAGDTREMYRVAQLNPRLAHPGRLSEYTNAYREAWNLMQDMERFRQHAPWLPCEVVYIEDRYDRDEDLLKFYECEGTITCIAHHWFGQWGDCRAPNCELVNGCAVPFNLFTRWYRKVAYYDLVDDGYDRELRDMVAVDSNPDEEPK